MFLRSLSAFMLVISLYGCATTSQMDQGITGNEGYVVGEPLAEEEMAEGEETRRDVNLNPWQIIEKADEWVQRTLW